MEKLDPLTRYGFDAITKSHGIRAAWGARIMALEAICETLPGNPYSIHQGGRFLELENARFELLWLDHPNNPDRL